MARLRDKKYKDLPEGLYYKKDRGVYIFRRVDGSTKSLGKNKSEAKRLAYSYNRTHRVDPELIHGLTTTGKESRTLNLKFKRLSDSLPEIFQKICDDKEWSEGTIKTRRNQFNSLNKFFGNFTGNEVSLNLVNEYLEKVSGGLSKNVYNRALYILRLVFDYCVDHSLMEENPAKKKIRKTIRAKSVDDIHRLSIDDFRKIHDLAGRKGLLWLQVAMELSLQTSQAVNEIAKLKYSDIKDGYMHIKRQKNQKSDASRVKLPLNDELREIITRSRKDDVLSPFVVHRQRIRRYRNRPLGSGIQHETQLPNVKISRTFSDLRDELGLYADVIKADRPTYHDIRALSIKWQEDNGYDAQARAAHSERQSTDVYKKGHDDWNTTEDVVIDWRKEAC